MAMRGINVKCVIYFLAQLFVITKGQLSYRVTINDCPSHLMRGGNLVVFKGRCYDFITYEEVTWEAANETCHKNAGRLVEIEDEGTDAFLSNFLLSRPSKGTGLWIGLNDKDEEGTWEWDSGSTASYRRWGSGEPGGFWGFTDDCAVMLPQGEWKDYMCDSFLETFGYVCQYDLRKG